MEIIKVGIFLEDRDFADKLAEGLAREYRKIEIYLLESFDDTDFLDLIISDKASEEINVVKAVKCIDQVLNNEAPPYEVCIYKDSANLINDLLFIYFKITGKKCGFKGGKKCKLVVFASDKGGVGVTTTAISAGINMKRIYGMRSLYMNLCPLDDSFQILRRQKGSLLKLQYYITTVSEFPIEWFITENIEIDCVNTEVNNSYFNEMNPELMRHFISMIETQGKYDFLIADIGNHISKENRELISMADQLVFISDDLGNSGEYSEIIYREITKLRGNKNILNCRISYKLDSYGISKKIVEDCEK